MKLCTQLLFTALILALFVAGSCKQSSTSSLIPTCNNGGYTLAVASTKETKSTIISGTLIDLETREPISFGRVWDGCSDLSVDSTGSYELFSTAYDNFRLIAPATGYREVETEPIAIKSGDSLRIDFYLIQNDQPLIDCMPSIAKTN